MLIRPHFRGFFTGINIDLALLETTSYLKEPLGKCEFSLMLNTPTFTVIAARRWATLPLPVKVRTANRAAKDRL